MCGFGVGCAVEGAGRKWRRVTALVVGGTA